MQAGRACPRGQQRKGQTGCRAQRPKWNLRTGAFVPPGLHLDQQRVVSLVAWTIRATGLGARQSSGTKRGIFTKQNRSPLPGCVCAPCA